MSGKNGDVAQLARASGSYPAGREFESPRRYHLNITRLQPSFFMSSYFKILKIDIIVETRLLIKEKLNKII